MALCSWIEFTCLAAAEPIGWDTVFLTTNSSIICGTFLMNLGKMKG